MQTPCQEEDLHGKPTDAEHFKRQRNLQAQRRCQAKQKVCGCDYIARDLQHPWQAKVHTLEAQRDELQAEVERLRAVHTALVRQGQLLQQRLCVEDERLVDALQPCLHAANASLFDAGDALPLVGIDEDGAVRLGTARMRVRADASKIRRFATTQAEVSPLYRPFFYPPSITISYL